MMSKNTMKCSAIQHSLFFIAQSLIHAKFLLLNILINIVRYECAIQGKHVSTRNESERGSGSSTERSLAGERGGARAHEVHEGNMT